MNKFCRIVIVFVRQNNTFNLLNCYSDIYKIIQFPCNVEGEIGAIKHLVIEGYDHIVDVHDEETIVNVAHSRGHEELGNYLESIPYFEVRI